MLSTFKNIILSGSAGITCLSLILAITMLNDLFASHTRPEFLGWVYDILALATQGLLLVVGLAFLFAMLGFAFATLRKT